MFDFSFLEIAVVLGIGLIVLKPEDMIEIVRFFKKTKRAIVEAGKQISDSLDHIEGVDALKKEMSDINTIIDMNGNPQRTYDIDDAKADISTYYNSKNDKEKKASPDKPKDSVDTPS